MEIKLKRNEVCFGEFIDHAYSYLRHNMPDIKEKRFEQHSERPRARCYLNGTPENKTYVSNAISPRGAEFTISSNYVNVVDVFVRYARERLGITKRPKVRYKRSK